MVDILTYLFFKTPHAQVSFFLFLNILLQYEVAVKYVTAGAHKPTAASCKCISIKVTVTNHAK